MQEIKELYGAGKLDQAKQVCQQLLSVEPNNEEVLHFYSLLLAEIGEINPAIDLLRHALAANPDSVALMLHLANVYKMADNNEEASALLRQLISDKPHYAPAHNNLGIIYFKQKNFLDAKQCFTQAIHLQANYVDAYYNLGLVLIKLQDSMAAQQCFEAILTLDPSHLAASYQIAVLLMREKQYAEAVKLFEKVITRQPYHLESCLNAGTCMLSLGRLNESAALYEKALAIEANNKEALYQLAVIATMLNEELSAINYYLQLLSHDPENFAAHYNLAVLYLQRQDDANALTHFQHALKQDPANEVILHSINALTNMPVLQAPSAYVNKLFEHYAARYDHHMQHILHYQVPELIFVMLKPFLSEPKSWRMLDLGCGTGLSGQRIFPYAKKLVGVDISQAMLEEASKKNSYDLLIHQDIHAYLAHTQEPVDLVMAADVFVYCGDLDNLFFNIARVLSAEGFFAFTIELGSEHHFTLSRSGRFQHSKAYIEHLAVRHHLKVMTQQSTVLRTQNSLPVLGMGFLLAKHP